MKKAAWVCALMCAAAMSAGAVQYTYSDNGGTVTLSNGGNTVNITAANVSSPPGTVTMTFPISCSSNVSTCSTGSVSKQSTDGSTTFNGTFTSGIWTLTYLYNYYGQIIGYDYALSARTWKAR